MTKLNFNNERFNQLVQTLDNQATTAAVQANPELLPVSVQFSIIWREDKALRAQLGHILEGLMLLPEDSVALLMALGYQMGLEDAHTATDVAELEKMFGEKNA